jgi:hypothetical protein
MTTVSTHSQNLNWYYSFQYFPHISLPFKVTALQAAHHMHPAQRNQPFQVITTKPVAKIVTFILNNYSTTCLTKFFVRYKYLSIRYRVHGPGIESRPNPKSTQPPVQGTRTSPGVNMV